MLLRPPRLRSIRLAAVVATFLLCSVFMGLMSLVEPSHRGSKLYTTTTVNPDHATSHKHTEQLNAKKFGRVFIAANHWNAEKVLRENWSPALIKLIDILGRDNVYFSSYESGSWDNTKGALRELQGNLTAMGVQHRMILDEKTHEQDVENPPEEEREGWIDVKGKKYLRRIPYLAKARNIVLEPLKDDNIRNATHDFGLVLFLNDVVFTPEDALRLMNTRGGDYAAACSLDFNVPHQYYDTFALRASDGRRTASLAWPYFGPGESRDALLRSEVVPVKSCWNGMVSFKAAPFISSQSPLRFRGIPDTLSKYHLEGSECCLIHFDNPLSKKHGVYLNPQVRVAYAKPNDRVYEAVRKWPTRRERVLGMFIRAATYVLNSPWRDGKIFNRVREWGGREEGVDCLIDEMQVLASNGWAHIW